MKHASAIKAANNDEARLREFDLREIDAPDKRSHFALKYLARLDAVVRAVATRVPSGGVVLEVGSAQANASLLLAEGGYQCIALDLMPEALAYSRKKREYGELGFVAGSAEALPIREASLDAIIVGELLEHCARPDEILRELARHLKPRGVMVITSPNAARAGSHEPTYSDVTADEVEAAQFGPGGEDHLFEFTPTELRTVVARAGLHPARTELHASILHSDKLGVLKRVLPPSWIRAVAAAVCAMPVIGPRTALTTLVVATGSDARVLILPDDQSRSRAAEMAAQLPEAVVVGSVLREGDLRLVRDPKIVAGQVEEVARRSREIVGEMARFMPPALTASSGEGEPSIWDCYGEYFRSWGIAPLLANATISRRAFDDRQPGEVRVVENPARPSWWTLRQQVYEAARTGLLGSGVEESARPGAALRCLRRALAGPLGLLTGLWQDTGGRRGASRGKWLKTLPGPEQADVLFLAIGATNVPIIDRLAPRLADQAGLSSAALMFDLDDMGMERSCATGVLYQFIDNFHPGGPGTLGAIARCGKVALGLPGWSWHVGRSGAHRWFGRAWQGIGQRLAFSLAKDTPRMIADMAAAARVLDEYQPRAIIALHLYWQRIAPLVLLARQRGIPVLYLQHGVYLAKDECIAPLPFDELMVFGEAAAEGLRPRVDGAPVTAVGHCLYDDLAARGARARETADLSPPLVFIATQPDEHDVYDVTAPDWWVRRVAQACEELGAGAVVKLHPREADTSAYRLLAEEMPDTVRIAEHGQQSMEELLGEAACLVARDSTVVLEANLLGVPTIVVNLTGAADRFPYVTDGGAVGVHDAGEIHSTLAAVLGAAPGEFEEDRRRFLKRHLGRADGLSAQTVTDVIVRHATGA